MNARGLMSKSKLLIIESPGKASKLKSILGSEWIVKASMGHVRELADSLEDNLGFELDGERVKCHYIPRDSRSKKVLSELRTAVRAASQVYLGTDPDREGETISWHLAEELKLKNPQRVTYTEITPTAVKLAIANPRPLDQNLIAAGRARDCLDKLVGYRGSPLVWPIGAKSVGRVQSATLRLICQREQLIISFRPETYYSVWVLYNEGFKAFYKKSRQSKPSNSANESHTAHDDAVSSNDDSTPESDRVQDPKEADRLVGIARNNPHQIIHIEAKTTAIKPPPPLTTSTLQQAAGSRLSLSPERTMQLAQKLYEQGHITYMRTDSVILSQDFCRAVEQYLQQHDPNNLPQKITKHRAAKNAQEAHEAIRPTHVQLTPSQLKSQLEADQAKLYELIWNRTVASLCAPAIVEKTRVITESGGVYWQAIGQVMKFPGYTVYWNNLSADKQLPQLNQGQLLTLKEAGADEKKTIPPPRYTEPKLVQLMERFGIGRPSTYSPTIKTLKARSYVELAKGKLSPTRLGMEVNTFLEKALPDLVDAQFTANMEQQLDEIASGKQNWERYLNSWNRDYFAPALTQAKGMVPTSTNPTSKTQVAGVEATEITCPKCAKKMIKVLSEKCTGGHFLSCDKRKGGCGTVMFLNRETQQYELPRSKQKPGSMLVDGKAGKEKVSSMSANQYHLPLSKVSQPNQLTEYACPVCGSPLECHRYVKDGESKKMLRCSLVSNRQGSCKDVVYWFSRGCFWSPTYGEISNSAQPVGKALTFLPSNQGCDDRHRQGGHKSDKLKL